MLSAVDAPQEDTLRAFAENLSGKLLSSSGDILDSVADGTDWVGITLEETALKRIAAGENLRMVYPSDGTSAVPDGSVLIRGAQHAENARRSISPSAATCSRFCRIRNSPAAVCAATSSRLRCWCGLKKFR